MVHCMSGISFGCIIWCPIAFTSLLIFSQSDYLIKLLIQIHILYDKQCRFRSVDFFRSQLIWIYFVCSGRAYLSKLAGPGLTMKMEHLTSSFCLLMCLIFVSVSKSGSPDTRGGWKISRLFLLLSFHMQLPTHILSKKRKYPGNIFHAWVNTNENFSLSNACFETWTI